MTKIQIALFTALFALVGCKDNFSGRIEIKKSLEFVTTQAPSGPPCSRPFDPNCNRNPKKVKVNLEPGVFSAEVRADSKTSVTLKVTDSNQKKKQIQLKVPKGNKLPQNDGPFVLEIPDTAYTARGVLNTHIQDSPEYSGYESCTWTETVRECTDVFDPQTGHYHRECHDRTIYHNGYQSVRYFNRETTKNIRFEINEPKINMDSLANFQGQAFDTDKIYTYQGICR